MKQRLSLAINIKDIKQQKELILRMRRTRDIQKWMYQARGTRKKVLENSGLDKEIV